MPTLDKVKGAFRSSPDNPEQQQRQRMTTALAVLAVALILVLVKDWRLLSPPPPSAPVTEANEPQTAPPPVAVVVQAPTPAPPPPSKPATQKPAPKKPPAPAPPKAAVEPPPTEAVSRTLLPPLEVDVRTLAGAVSPPAAGQSQPANGAQSNATERVQLSPDTAQALDRPVKPTYPLLAKQMKVQGPVVLEALITKTGDIQEIQVLSGPAILSAAAREAVRQWRFKPHLQRGKPVDTQARITINFTISPD